MSHYFDDVFHRHVNPKSPHPGGGSMPRIRRSSTARSIEARSDFGSEANGVDGDDDERSRAGSMSNSAILNDPQRLRERAEADAHLHRYVSDQLERVKSAEDTNGVEAEEFEAQL
jgi:hypothetical protein